jgi:integrase
MQDGGSRRFIAPLIKHFGAMPIEKIDQAAIDAAAIAIHPATTPATRARQVYTPVSSILHHHFGDNAPVVKRPKGAKGIERKDFMWPEDAFAIIDEAERIDAEFAVYLLSLLYTGIRKSEGLRFLSQDMRPDMAWLRDSKNGDPRMLRLRQELADRIHAHLETNPGRERVFRFKDGGYFKHLLLRATMAACGLECPKRRVTGWKKPKFRLAFVGFHTFRHTWATWMRMFGGADLQGLVGTKNWKNIRSVERYAHVVPRDEWDRVDKLPAAGTGRGMKASGTKT